MSPFIRLPRLPYETRFIVSVPDEVWVTDAVALDGSHVALRFSDGHCGVLDMSPYMDDGVFKRLRDPNVFKTARAGVNTVEWDNGTIDVAPETAYAQAAPFGA
ncbi:hypothetical protein CE164_10470 [Bifidobacterium breve]|nr:hypothetical protein CE164_10470 [Bifidobacterium breve]